MTNLSLTDLIKRSKSNESLPSHTTATPKIVLPQAKKTKLPTQTVQQSTTKSNVLLERNKRPETEKRIKLNLSKETTYNTNSRTSDNKTSNSLTKQNKPKILLNLRGTGLRKRELERQITREEKAETALYEQPELQTEEIGVVKEFKAQTTNLEISTSEKQFDFDQSQEDALTGLVDQQYGCLIGAAGCGKTKVTNDLLHAIELTYPNALVYLCSFMGRAVQMMKKATDIKYHAHCATIHRTLRFYPDYFPVYDDEQGKYVERMRFVPEYTADKKLPCDVIIIDETQTLDIALWHQVLDALKPTCRIFLVGDINQIPPVHGRSVLGFAMLKWPTFELTTLHRNAGIIAQNAHRILNGELPTSDPEKFIQVEAKGSVMETYALTKACIIKLAEKEVYSYITDTLLVPQNKDTIGQIHFNQDLVLHFNPPIMQGNAIVNKRTIIKAGYVNLSLAIGDKVMLLENDNEKNLTNGMIGIITNIVPNEAYRGKLTETMVMAHTAVKLSITMDEFSQHLDSSVEAKKKKKEEKEETEQQASHIVTVQFGEIDNKKEVMFRTAGHLKKFTHAYACTIHKALGGEYPVVVILCHSTNRMMLYRELLYTAVTRAQKMVVLIYDQRGLMMSLNNQKIKGKTLAEKAKRFIELQKSDTAAKPEIPNAKLFEGIKK